VAEHHLRLGSGDKCLRGSPPGYRALVQQVERRSRMSSADESSSNRRDRVRLDDQQRIARRVRKRRWLRRDTPANLLVVDTAASS
jgi:hypothetical protein